MGETPHLDSVGIGPRGVFSPHQLYAGDGIAGRLLTTEDKNNDDGWSAHSRALGFLLPVSPDARGVNFSSTTEKQHDQGTDGRIVPPHQDAVCDSGIPTAAPAGSFDRN